LPDRLTSSNDEFKKLVLVYANFAFCSTSYNRLRSSDLFYKKFKRLIDKVPLLLDNFSNALINSSDTNVHSLVLCSYILKYYQEKSIDYQNAKNSFIDLHNKHLLSVRTKLPIYISENSNLLVKYATRDDFKDKIMPGLQRALLRNPEIILECNKKRKFY
jgi:hypothetical protein